MLNEFKILLKIQNFLLENYEIDNNHSLKIAQEILEIFNKYNLKLPEDTNIKKIDIENDKLFKVSYKNNKTENIKIGKLLLTLFPELSEKPSYLQKIIDDIKKVIINFSPESLYNNYKIEIISEDISEYYKKFEFCGLGSCMTKLNNIEDVLKFYDINPDIKLLLIRNKTKNNKIVGRALMWHNVNGNKTLIDRFYGDISYYELLKIYAKKNNYILKNSDNTNSFYDFSSSEIVNEPKEIVLYYKIPEKILQIITLMPYLDTLCYCDSNYVLSNKSSANTLFIFNNSFGSTFYYFDNNFFESDKFKRFFKVEIYCKKEMLNGDYSYYENENNGETSELETFYKEIMLPILNNNILIYDDNIDLIVVRNSILNKGDDFLCYACIWKNTSYKKPIVGFIYFTLTNLQKIFFNNNYVNIIKETAENLIKEKIKEKGLINIEDIYRKEEITFQIDFEVLKSTNIIHKDWVDFFDYITPTGLLISVKKEDVEEISSLPYRYNFQYNENVKIEFYKNLEDKKWDYFLNFNDIKNVIKFFKTFLIVGKENKNKNIGEIYFLENDIWDDSKEKFEGIITNSEWNDGYFVNGIIYNCIWKNGFLENGTFIKSYWENGICKEGSFINSIITDGEFNNITLSKSVVKNAKVTYGFLRNTIWENGELEKGSIVWGTTWENGIFHKKADWNNYPNMKNKWIKGKIECKKYEGKFVESKINPKEFWELEEKTNSFKEFMEILRKKEKEIKN